MIKVPGSYRIGMDLIKKVKVHAEKERRSFNNMLEVLIYEGLKARSEKDDKAEDFYKLTRGKLWENTAALTII